MAVREQRGSDPSPVWPVLTAEVTSKDFSNESKRTSMTTSEVLSAQTASSGETPGPYFCGEREVATRTISKPVRVLTHLTRFPTPPLVATYQPPPPSRMPESRPLPAPPQHSQPSPVREKGHNSRLSDTNPMPPRHPSYPPLPKYSPQEPEQTFDDDVSELSPHNSPTSPSVSFHPRQQPHTASLPSNAYDSNHPYFQGPHEDQNVYTSGLSSSSAHYTTRFPVTSVPVNDTSRTTARTERPPRHSNPTHFATPTRLEYDPSTPINTPDHFFPPSPTNMLGLSGNMDDGQVKGPPTMPKVYPPGRSAARPKSKGGAQGSDAPKLHLANSTPNAVASGSTNISPLSDLPMPTPLMSPDDVQPSSSSLPSTALSKPQTPNKNTSPSTSPTTGTPTTFIYPSGRSAAGPKFKPKLSASSHNTEQSGFKFLRLLKDWNKDSKKRDKGKQKQQEEEEEEEDGSDTQSVSVRSGSPPLSISSSGYLVGTADLETEDSDKEQVFDIQRASNPNTREMDVGVGGEHMEGGPSKSRIGNYPLDPFDTVLLDHDRRTGELLRRLNPTDSPTFYDYGTSPPREVLDLGCGQGHWVVQAAIKWSGYGTKVTGYDKVDISKPTLPLTIEHGVKDVIKFVRGNFLKQRLPFEDDTFDLVRMSCLTLCIPTDAWAHVFAEVCRVMAPSGRLEVIEDSIIFPPPPLVATVPLDLEFLFEQMLRWTFGISLHPPETFIPQSMKDIFGYGELAMVMRLTLAHSRPKEDEAADTGESSSAGLLLLPSTFFPMEQEEVDMHMLRHMRSLLSCKHLLVEYATETATREEVNDEMVLEALYEYESSMRRRFEPLDTNGQVSGLPISSDMTGTIRTFRVFEAIKIERIP